MYELQKERVKKNLSTDFEKNLCESIFQNLEDLTNRLRFNNFSYALRELTRLVLYRLSPDENVLNCNWYRNEIPERDNGITRGQRIKYAVQGGMDNNFVNNKLNIDLKQLNRNWKYAIDIFNKHTHVNEDSYNIEDEKIEEFVENGVKCFEYLFSMIYRSRDLVLLKLNNKLERKIIDNVIESYFEEIGRLSTHYETNGIEVSKYRVVKLDDKNIEICVRGNIDVTLQYGSYSDLRNDNGLRTEEYIPFHSHLIEDIKKINKANPELLWFNVEPEEPEVSDEELDKFIEEELRRREEE